MRGLRQSIQGRNLIEINSINAIEHILLHRPSRIKKLFINSKAASGNTKVVDLYQKAKIARVPVDASVGSTSSDSPLRATIHPFSFETLDRLLEASKIKVNSVVLALDHLQDPQNFGALCRTAEALGVSGIITPKDRSVSLGTGVYHSSVGSVETVPVVLVTNLAESLRVLKANGYWIVGSSLGRGARSPSDIPEFDKVCLVLGAEDEGMSYGISKLCDWHVEIPLCGSVQSLNVSVAGGILLWHLTSRVHRKAHELHGQSLPS